MKKLKCILLLTLFVVVIGPLLIFFKKIKSDNKEIISKLVKEENINQISYKKQDQEDGLVYSWTFDKNSEYNDYIEENHKINIDLGLKILNENNNNIINDMVEREKLILSFNHHGSLPTTAHMKVNVSGKYKNGEKLNLYYYNEEENKIELINDNIIVQDNLAEFEIEHCSDYFLTASIVQDTANPQNINIIIIIMVIVVLGLLASTLSQNRK